MMTPTPNPDFVYKIASVAAWAAARIAGEVPRMPVDRKDGYIHFSTAAQLRETLRLHFAGQDELVLLAIRTADLGAGLRWELSRGGQLFPHHYGELGSGAVAATARIAVAEDGAVVLPEWVR
jgi:uncharacterized protein (DUF952 family)